jgi:methionyl-tRNA synthetase
MTRRYITVSIPYVNARPHLGYALELVEADALTRLWRAAGDDVRLQAGTDDHSLKNVLAALEAGVPTQTLVDGHAAEFESLQQSLGIEVDEFVRTSLDDRHRATVEALWRRSAARGDFYLRRYEALYCVGCEQFYADADLVDGGCPDHDAPLELVAEENWFFRLSRYQDAIEDLLTSGRLRIEPQAYANEALSFVRGGLEDISVSRPSSRARRWGIPVPGDESQVVYVWWDALANYISGLGFASNHGDYTRWWTEAAERIHVIGKGILRFHAVYWPALLLSAGEPPPTTLFVHPYLTAEGRKLSKSSGNVVDPAGVSERFGVDPLRWWLLADVPRASDADYEDAKLERRWDDDIANGLGNLATRVAGLIHRFRAGVAPEADWAATIPHNVVEAAQVFDFRTIVEAARQQIAKGNQLIEASEPWVLARRESHGDRSAGDELDRVLAEATAVLAQLCSVLGPLLPGSIEVVARALRPDIDGRIPAPVPLLPRVGRTHHQLTAPNSASSPA